MADIFDLSDVWNDGATTFTGIGLDVTDTASASGSLLMDLQVGGSSKFSVDKNSTLVLKYTGSNRLIFISPSVGGGEARIAAAGSFALAAGGADAGSSPDIFLTRDAADTLAQRRSTNPQAFRVYNSYTDGSNFERGFVAWDTNVLKIGTQAAGTGTARSVQIIGGPEPKLIGSTLVDLVQGGVVIRLFGGNFYPVNNTTNLGRDANPWRDLVQIGYHQMTEMTAPAAPAANGVRIYAEDDGAGKTRLMALFATGAAQQIAIEP
jgi:hypothetical protein